ncbi:MAG: hypothetical protein JWM01_474 [Arthrobacter sp.]|nr:hypothetical protein [Arthrobacter sp.]
MAPLYRPGRRPWASGVSASPTRTVTGAVPRWTRMLLPWRRRWFQRRPCPVRSGVPRPTIPAGLPRQRADRPGLKRRQQCRKAGSTRPQPPSGSGDGVGGTAPGPGYRCPVCGGRNEAAGAELSNPRGLIPGASDYVGQRERSAKRLTPDVRSQACAPSDCKTALDSKSPELLPRLGVSASLNLW